MQEKKNLYFIAIIPAQETGDEITRFKKDFADRFESKKALKVMPHITLKAPFKLPVSEHSKLKQWFQKLFINVEPFEMELKGFGAFRNKNSRVVFVQPVMKTQLYSLQREIIRSFSLFYLHEPIMDLEIKYAPHITVAYRDLDPEKFRQAWKEYQEKKYIATFWVNDFHLLQHNGTEWKIISTYSLRGSRLN
ncbi:MAG TPA: 2'-5' RNA ligase family protein [Chitinophagaceae bacterium]|nr:2'-5' RNA ligase family protein [Chitinophagaceae bacterium]